MRAVACCLVSLTLAASPGQASAQEDLDERARALFDEAVAFIDAAHYPEAVARLERALEIQAHPAIAYNLGVALLGSGKALRARALLESLRSGAYGQLPPERLAAAVALLADANEQIGTLRIAVRGPERAEVRVSGAAPARVTGGSEISIDVDPGDARVVVSARDYRTVSRSVTLAPGGDASLTVELEREVDLRPSRVLLRADDPDAEIEIVGRARREGSLEASLAPGEYRVRVWLSGEVSETRIEVPGGRELTLDVAAPATGSVLTSPWFWAAVTVVALTGAGIGIWLATRPRDPVEVPPWGSFVALRSP